MTPRGGGSEQPVKMPIGLSGSKIQYKKNSLALQSVSIQYELPTGYKTQTGYKHGLAMKCGLGLKNAALPINLKKC